VTTIDRSARLTVFYDGACPLCLREVNFIKKRDRASSINFRDIASPDFRAEDYGFTYAALMERMYAVLPNGRVISGVEVFRQLYTRIGFSFAVSLSRAPLVRQLLDLFYELWAKHRLRLTGRCDESGCALPLSKHEAPSGPATHPF
jgi:predicted DCC family thiol-disulfide oxidoreductase YuxK